MFFFKYQVLEIENKEKYSSESKWKPAELFQTKVSNTA